MPSHVFTRLGMWRESVESNLRSAAAAKAEGNGQEQAHAVDYLVLAYLQLGLSAEAKRVVDESATRTVNPTVFIGPFALAAMPARYALERRAWNEAIQLTARPSRFPFTEATTFFARGLGFANTGGLRRLRTQEIRRAPNWWRPGRISSDEPRPRPWAISLCSCPVRASICSFTVFSQAAAGWVGWLQCARPVPRAEASGSSESARVEPAGWQRRW